MGEDWYIFKQEGTYKEFKYITFLSYTYTTKEKNEILKEIADQHKDGTILAMKVVKGYET